MLYDESAKNQVYEEAQTLITQKKEYNFVGEYRKLRLNIVSTDDDETLKLNCI